MTIKGTLEIIILSLKAQKVLRQQQQQHQQKVLKIHNVYCFLPAWHHHIQKLK